MNDSLHLLHTPVKLLPDVFSRMADDPPPPPYIAAMMQQFELNRQFMTGVMAQFPNQNAHQQPAPTTLPKFVRLNPSIFSNSTNSMDVYDWLRDIMLT